jgi:hypothetical protein
VSPRYDAAFKAAALARLQTHSLKEVATEFGIDPRTVLSWQLSAISEETGWTCQDSQWLQVCTRPTLHQHCPRCGVILDEQAPRAYRPSTAGVCCWGLTYAVWHPASPKEAA